MKRAIFSEKSILSGSITAPPSKSYSHRLLFLSLISKKPISITNLLSANDITRSVEACKQLGMQIQQKSKDTILCIPSNILKCDNIPIDCGNSGTTVRFLVGLSLAIKGPIILSGEFFSRNRPILPMLDAMKALGTKYNYDNNQVTLETPFINESSIKIPGQISSQFISGLIYGIVALAIRSDIANKKKFHHSQFTVETTTPVVSFPYIELTKKIFQEFGLEILISTLPEGRIKVNIPIPPDFEFTKNSYSIHGDFSSAAPIMYAATLFDKNWVQIGNLNPNDSQPDQIIHQLLSTKEKSIDCSNNPDLFPILCVKGAFTNDSTTLTGITHIRFKESDRVGCMIRELRKFGIEIESSPNSVIIHGSSKIELSSDIKIPNINDHRILMALTVFALGVHYNGYTVTIHNIECINDSYPRFFKDLRSLGGKFQIE